ncbi:4-phosphoerythronate dehydrogenase PdxB [Aurantivibrio infirmus]
MKIVVDENAPLAREFFSHLGDVSLVSARDLSPSVTEQADALIVRSTVRITKELLANSNVKFVGTCTAGDDHFDKAAMDEFGIQFFSAPGCNAESVVEYVFSSLVALGRDWRGSTVGIIGRGHVGGLLYKKMTSLGVSCRSYDPFLNPGSTADLCELDEVLQSEIVCCHAPLTYSGEFPSFHLLGRSQLESLAKDAVLISAGRGAVVDNDALLSVLERREDLKVVLDVWEGEPNISQKLFERVDLATPHIAGHSYDGKVKGTEMIYKRLCQFLEKEPERKLANLEEPVSDNCVRLTKRNFLEAIGEAIHSVYNVRQDSEHFRQAYDSELFDGKKDMGKLFDSLRKQYPMRREFQKFRVKLLEPNQPIEGALKTLGFTLVE